MKNKIISFLVMVLVIAFCASNMQAAIYSSKTLRTGGTSAAMDSIDGADLSDGDECRLKLAGNIFEIWVLDADSGLTEDEDNGIVAPDTNPGSKRWIRQKFNYEGINVENLTLEGACNLTTLANINDIFVYDTSKDSDGGAWRTDERSKSSSWYNETLSSSTRGSRREFPEKAVLVATNAYLYIYDAKNNLMWIRFDEGANQALPTGTWSSVYGIEGKCYITDSGGSGLYVIDFINDKITRYDATDARDADSTIDNRNGTVAYINQARTGNALVSATINDVHVRLVNGKTYIAVATDSGVSIIHAEDETTYDYSDVTDYDYNACWLDVKGNLYTVDETHAQVEKWSLVVNDSSDEANGTPDQVWDQSSIPALWTTTLTIATSAPDQLCVIDSASIADGESNIILFAHAGGLTRLDEDGTTAANSIVKYYTKDYVTESLLGDIRGMWPFDEAHDGNLNDGDYVEDGTDGNNDLESVNGATAVSGVRGKGFTLNGSTQYFKQKVFHDETDDNASYDSANTNLTDGTAAFSITDSDTNLETLYEDTSGDSSYYLEATDPNGLIMWGYIRDVGSSSPYVMDIYDDLAGSNQNWNGDEASMTAASTMTWDIRKTGFQGTWANGMSCGGWMKNPDGNDSIIAKWEGGASTNNAFLLYLTADGYAQFGVRNSSTSYTATGAIDISDDEWHFIVGTYNPSTAVKVYVDGVCINTNTTSIPATLNDIYLPLSVGAYYGSGYIATAFWNGEIDEPFVSAEVYGPGVIKAMYEAGHHSLENHTASRVPGITGADNYQRLQGGVNTAKAVAVDDGNHFLYVGTNDSGSNTGALSVVGIDSDSIVDLYSSTNTVQDDCNDVQFDINDIVAIGISGTPVHGYNLGDPNSSTSSTLAIAGTDDSSTGLWSENSDISLYSFISRHGGPDLSKRNIKARSLTILPGENLRDSTTGEPLQTPAFYASEDGNLQISGSATIPKLNYAADAGGTDAYAITLSPAAKSYERLAVYFYANTANTGACTLNVNGLGAKALKILHDQDPPDDYIEAGSIIHAIYDGTNFQIIGPGDANP